MTTSTFREPAPAAPPSRRTRRGFRLFPREEAFFDLFVQDAANLLAGAQRLHEMLEEYTLHDGLANLSGFKGLNGHWAEIHRPHLQR